MNQVVLSEKLQRVKNLLQKFLPKSAKQRQSSAQLSSAASTKNAASNSSQLLVLAAMLILVPSMAHAEPWDGLGDAVLDIFTNGLTRTIAIIAVVGCGIAAMAGKLSWQWVINITIGITLIFGSAAIVDYFVAAAAN